MFIKRSTLNRMHEVMRNRCDRLAKSQMAVELLTQENLRLNARIGELEGLLFGYGVIDRFGQIRPTAMELLSLKKEAGEL